MSDLIGDLLDARNVRATIDNDEMLADAVVILRVVGADGESHVSLAWSDGMDWISRRGLIEVARDSERVNPASDIEDDDE